MAFPGINKMLLAVGLTAVAAPALAQTAPYDSAYAASLGADEFGMRPYVMAFLKKGPNRPADPKQRAELQRGHMANIARLAEAGTLIVAGPFLDTGELRGIYIFKVKTIEEARQLTETDPAIQAGSLVMELKPWYGSAALLETNRIHNRIARKQP